MTRACRRLAAYPPARAVGRQPRRGARRPRRPDSVREWHGNGPTRLRAIVVSDRVVGARAGRQHVAMRPLDLDRSDREEQWAGEVAFAADASLADCLPGDHRRHALAEFGRAERLDRHEIDAACIVVLRPSLAKRVMRWMPDSPAVSLAQLSAFPAPSEVMMPLPVTTTPGRSFLPRDDAIQAPFTSPPRPAP